MADRTTFRTICRSAGRTIAGSFALGLAAALLCSCCSRHALADEAPSAPDPLLVQALTRFEERINGRDFEGAADVAPDVIKAARKTLADSPERLMRALFLVGYKLSQIGQFDAALNVWKQAEEAAERVPKFEDTRLHCVGRQIECQLFQQDYEAAQRTYARAKKLMEDHTFAPEEAARIWQYYGHALAAVGREQEAIAAFAEANRLRLTGRPIQQLDPLEINEIAKTRLAMAAGYLSLREDSLAEKALDEGGRWTALANVSPELQVAASTLKGQAAWARGDVAAARAAFEDAYKLALKSVQVDNRFQSFPALKASQSVLGDFECRQGNLVRAAALLATDASIAVVTLHARQGNWEIWPFMCGAELNHQIREARSLLPYQTEAEQLLYVRRWAGLKHKLDTLLGEIDPTAAKVLDRQSIEWPLNSKGLIQETLTAKLNLAKLSRDPKFHELIGVREKIARLSLVQQDSPSATPQDGIVAAMNLGALRTKEAELEMKMRPSLETELKQGEGRDAVLPRELARSLLLVTPDEAWRTSAAFEQAIPEGCLYVDFVKVHHAPRPQPKWRDRGEPQYVAWLRTGGAQGSTKVVVLSDAKSVDKAVDELRKQIADDARALAKQERDLESREDADAVRARLAKLGQILLEPLWPSIKDARRLVICPDGPLWLVPWSALITPEGHYLIERPGLEIMLVTSGRDLLPPERRSPLPEAVRSFAIFGNPSFSTEKAEAAATGPDKSPAGGLPEANRRRLFDGTVGPLDLYSQFEAKHTCDILGKKYGVKIEPKTGEDANEKAVKAVRGPFVLMLSTHANFQADDVPTRNPLLRCGLALAGVNDQRAESGEDGILTGLEITMLDLQGTELVVLSACNTAVGDPETAESVACLRQAFQLAGAKNVLATLWPVSNAKTPDLVFGFLDQWNAGKSLAASLAEAQRKALTSPETANPFFWSGLTLTGRPEK